MYFCSTTVAPKPINAIEAGTTAPTLAMSAASTSEMPAMSAPTARGTEPGIGRFARR